MSAMLPCARHFFVFLLLGALLTGRLDGADATGPNKTPATSAHFVKWTDPDGVVSYLLRNEAAVQETGYFTQKMYTRDGRYLWFVARGAEGKKKDSYLGVIDFRFDTVKLFPETRFDGSSPVVDLASGGCYYVEARDGADTKTGWKLERIAPDGTLTAINRVPHPAGETGDPRQVTTHLTFNASHTAVGFDCGQFPETNHTYAGIIPLDGSAPVVWHVYDRRMDHAQMSPTDDHLMLIAQDYYDHRAGGKTTRVGVTNRTWLLRSDGETQPLLSDREGAYNSHEWWDANGRDIWFTDRKGVALPQAGTGRIDITTGKTTLVWPGAADISESDRSQRYLVGDNYKEWSLGKPVRIDFYDAQTRGKIGIATSLPVPVDEDQQHHQPNGHFECNDTWIAYTTDVQGKLTLALTPVEPLKVAVAKR